MFTINQLDRKTDGGVVYSIHWSAVVTDSDYSASTYGVVSIPEKTPDSSEFVPYEELTLEIVQNWLLEALGEEQVQSIEDSLLKQIELQKNPVTASGLPW